MRDSSCTFIKAGVDEGLPPFTPITLRLGIGFTIRQDSQGSV
jgi:hypothetical protein